jgi:hypothetical protein
VPPLRGFLLMVVLSQDSAALHPGLSSFHPSGVEASFWGCFPRTALRLSWAIFFSSLRGGGIFLGVLSQDCAALHPGLFSFRPYGTPYELMVSPTPR